jgi:SAM-dependent methyltransferase
MAGTRPKTDELRPPRYGEDLAYIHDVGYGGFAHGLAPGLLDTLRESGIHDGVVVDLGCGSGIWAKYLTDAGYDTVGVDLSPAMIRLARRRAPDAQFHVESFLTFDLPRCRAITALGEVLCYLLDEANNRKTLARHFKRAADALDSGGLLIFDVPEVGLDKGRPPTGRAAADWACLVRLEYDDSRHQLTRHITSFRRRGRSYRRQEEVHRLQLYRRGEVADMLRSAGFRVRTVSGFGGCDLLPGRIGFVAQQP